MFHDVNIVLQHHHMSGGNHEIIHDDRGEIRGKGKKVHDDHEDRMRNRNFCSSFRSFSEPKSYNQMMITGIPMT